MKIEKEQLQASRWLLTVEVPTDDVQAEIESELTKVQQGAEMPGFRRGKVPLNLIRQRYAKAVEMDIVQKRLSEHYEAALKESGIGEPVAPPEISIIQLEIGKPFIFKATVDVHPPIELAAYDGLTVVRERATVGEEEVNQEIERLRERQAVLHDDNSPAAENSLLEVDLQELDASFLPVIGRKREGILIDLGKSREEIRKSLLGVRASESRNIALPQPTKSPEAEKKFDHYQVTVKNVKRKELPELNDDFARSLGTTIENMDNVRDILHRQIQAEVEAISYQRMSHLLVHQVVDNSRLEVPEGMLKNYLDRLVEGARKKARPEDGPFDETLIRDRYRGSATWDLKWYLIRKEIATKEELTVTEDDLEKEYERRAAASGKKPKQIKAQYAESGKQHQLEDDLLERKVLQALMNKARIIERTVSFEEFFAKENGEHEHVK